MFLRPQHFQQFDRYLQAHVDARVRPARPDTWGFDRLVIDEQALALGRIGFSEARGIFPDGTPFNIPAEDPAPPALEVPEGVKNSEVFFALPLASPGRPEVDRDDVNDQMTRYLPRDEGVRDAVAGTELEADIVVGGTNGRFLLTGEERSDFACIGVAEVVEKRADAQVILNNRYIPTSINCLNSPRLKGFADEIHGLVRHRAEALAARVVQSGQSGVAEIADFLMLQVANRTSGLLEHLAQQDGLHPEALYRVLLMLDGELATFTQPSKLAQAYPSYRHQALRESFDPIMQSLRSALSMVLEQNAVAIPLVDRRGVRVGKIADLDLLQSAVFVLAAKAAVSPEEMRSGLPKQIKIGSVEVIRDLVNKQIPGISISAMPVAPRQIPFHVGFCYFELDRSGEHWGLLSKTGGIALHVAGGFPELELELWAIRG